MATIFNVMNNNIKPPTLPTIPIVKLKFKKNKPKIEDVNIFVFYQICKFPTNEQYNIRKITYNEYGEMITYKIGKISKFKLNTFLSTASQSKYAMYPTYNLTDIRFPEPHVISVLTSHILNNY
jgi:hypothetical protein